jgi:alanine-glyoxylate transaminase/serine-glyoxylate transaminase/serine-pyruvate transaminase
MDHPTGRHFLQIPGPTNTPLPVLAAIAKPTIDHRGPEFGRLGREVLAGIRTIFKTENPVVIYPASGTGAWEAALVNTLSPGDRVLMVETGWFATLWSRMAKKLGLEVELIEGDWRSGVDAGAIEARLAEDKGHAIKAVCIVHNETSTGVTSGVAAVQARDRQGGHPALLLVGHDLVARLHRLPARRMGRRRHGRRVAEGPDAAAGPVVQRDLGQGGCGVEEREAAARLLGLGGDAGDQRQGLLPLHALHEPRAGLKVAIGMLHEEGSTTSSPATTAPPRRRAAASAIGASRSSAATRPSTPPRSPAVRLPKGTRPTPCGPRSSGAPTCPRQRARARSPTGCSASAISADFTTSW